MATISRERSGNVHSVKFRWVTGGSGEDVRLDTFDLIKLFGIPEGMHLSFHQIASRSSGASNFGVIIDGALKGGVPTASQDFVDAVIDQVDMFHEAADDYPIKPLFGMHCIDELVFTTGNTSITFVIEFIFEYISGSMRLIDDLGLLIGDITQVSPNRAPGTEWYQPGPIIQIGTSNVPEQ